MSFRGCEHDAMVTSKLSATTASPAVRFHLNLADRTETETVDRYRRYSRLAADILDAARRADAYMRLEMALSGMAAGSQAA